MNGPAFWNKLLNDVNDTWRTVGTVAGGAIRDWMLGIEPNDIDIFLERSFDRADHDLVPEGWEYLRTVGHDEYPNAGDEFNVAEYRVDDTIVQVMFLRNGFFEHYRLFDNNLTKGYYEPRQIFAAGKLIIGDDLLYGLEHQVIYPLVGHNGDVNTRMNEQRERLNQTMPGWRIQDNNPLVPPVQAPRAVGGGLALADFANAVQVGAQPVRVNNNLADAFAEIAARPV